MLGILLASRFSYLYLFISGISIFLIAVSIGLHYYTRRKLSHNAIKLNSWLLLFILLCSGFLLHTGNNQILWPKHFGKFKNASSYVVRVTNNPSLKPKSIGTEVKVLQVIDSLGTYDCIGKAQLFFKIDSLSESIKYGDVLLVSNSLRRIDKPSNPHQFDFRKYYQTKNIFHNGFITANNWKSIGFNKGNWLYIFSYKVQNKLQTKFKQYFKNESVRGVAQAIVFGYKEELDEEWLQAFSKTGTIHVLAVSGLHVGIIYILLAFVLGLKRSKGKSLAIKTTVILAVLFFYSLITGFSPSVSRASIMFGLVLLSSVFAQKTSIYNTLSFACLVLLIANPNNLFNVGFQFSFLAVFGIVYYKDKFRGLFPTSNWLLDKIIMLMAVSIAAQITTFPLGLYYFHQYPNLFMFSNLIVIPCITIILYGGIFFVVSSFVSSITATFLAGFIGAYIQFISSAVLYIQDLPFAFFENVYISFWQMVLIYVVLFVTTFVWANKWKAGLWVPIAGIALFLCVETVQHKSAQKAEVISFYDTKETLLVFRQNNRATFFASKGIYIDKNATEFIIMPYVVNEGVSKYEILPIETLKRPFNINGVSGYGNGAVWFNNKSYLVLDEVKEYITDTITTDYVLIGSKKSAKYIKAVSPLINAKSVLICSNAKNNTLSAIKSEKLFSRNFSTFRKGKSTYMNL